MTRTISLLFLAASSLSLSGCKRDSSGDGAAEPHVTVSASASGSRGRVVTVSSKLLSSGRVQIATASLAASREDLTVTGEVTAAADGAAEIGAPISGIVREILAKEGDRVAKGAALAKLDAAEVARTAAELGRAEARRERAQRVLRQEQQLMRDNATSERNLAEAESELRTAEAEARGARALLTTFGAANSGRIVVRSPIDGSVVSRSIVLGKSVEGGTRMFRVVNSDKLVVRADVPESDAADIADDAAATLRWPARKITCTASVEARSASVDAMTRTVPFRLRPSKDCPVLVEGGFVDVMLPRQAVGESGLVALPRDGVVELEGVPVVFLATPRPEEFRAVTVRLARTTGNTAYVAEGIAAGERVVVAGAILLKGELMRAALE